MNDKTSQDIRWQQRFSNFNKALSNLERYSALEHELSELEKQGLIQAFEYTFELAWNTIKDFYAAQGENNIQGGRDAIKLGFKRGLITDGEEWMSMIQDRNRSSHTYNQETAEEIVDNIHNKYLDLFMDLQKKLKEFLKEKK